MISPRGAILDVRERDKVKVGNWTTRLGLYALPDPPCADEHLSDKVIV
jgi:hypothetical protein